VEHRVRQLCGPVRLMGRIAVFRDSGDDRDVAALDVLEGEAVAAAGTALCRGGGDLAETGIAARLSVEDVDVPLAGDGEVDAHQLRLRALVEDEHMMLRPGGA